jgi:histidyl-tRNA synthetase
MANKTKFQAIKGTRDLLPPETELWNRVEQTAREVFGTFGFSEIRLPIIEETELFGRAIGVETDIISKEMFAWQEGGTIVESELPKFWMLKHLGEFSAASPEFIFDNRQRPDLLVSKGDQTLVVEFKRRTINQATVENIRQYRRVFKEQFPDQKSPKLLLVFAEEPSDFVRSLAAANDVEVEVLDVPEYEPRESLSLRPEATASVCRAYIEQGMQGLAQPVKLYYMGPMFRRERPQKGRYRQFYQIGAEVLEAITPNTDATKSLGKDAAVDAEVIEMVMVYFARLGLEGVVLDINSIGHSAPDCRRGYVEKLKRELEKVKDQLGEDSKRRIETNPLRVLDSKLESEQAIIEKLPRIGDHLCADCAKHYAEVKRQLDLRGVPYQENWRLVRGLDYYMRTTFEITARGLGSQNAVCGGGRYDGLVELLGGPPTKGIGFAIGEDRVILSLQEAGKVDMAQGLDVYIAWMGEKTLATAIRAARDLRQAGLRVELPPVEQKFGKALGQADKLGARYALILGEDEVASGQWTLKTLADGTQGKYSEAGLLEFLRRQRGEKVKE